MDPTANTRGRRHGPPRARQVGHPELARTRAAPAHRRAGRPGPAFDPRTLLDRRSLLRAVELGAVGVGLAACSRPGASSGSSSATISARASSGATSSLTEVPEETAGPYPGDGSNGPDVLQQSGIVRSDIRSSVGAAAGRAEGVPMTLEMTVRNLAAGGSPFAGVAVYVWHCDRESRYSMYSDGLADVTYLRGVQVADASGVVRFTSIFPACYSGRWPHIHFEVYPDQASITDASTAIATSQIALPHDVCTTVYAQEGYRQSEQNLRRVSLRTDNVFGEDGGASQLATVTGDVATGYTVRLTVGVDPSTPPGRGAGPAGSDGRPQGAPNGAPPTRR